jgi:hypothetical protein
MQTGNYVVRPADVPLYKIDLCDPGKADLCVTPLEAGDQLRNSGLRVAAVRGE